MRKTHLVANHLFNEHVVPLLQPDPNDPGSTRDWSDRQPDAILPRRDDPETGFDVRHPWRDVSREPFPRAADE